MAGAISGSQAASTAVTPLAEALLACICSWNTMQGGALPRSTQLGSRPSSLLPEMSLYVPAAAQSSQ